MFGKNSSVGVVIMLPDWFNKGMSSVDAFGKETPMFEYLCTLADGTIIQVVTSGDPLTVVDAIDVVTIGEYSFANDAWAVR